MRNRAATYRYTDSQHGERPPGSRAEWPVDTVAELRDR